MKHPPCHSINAAEVEREAIASKLLQSWLQSLSAEVPAFEMDSRLNSCPFQVFLVSWPFYLFLLLLLFPPNLGGAWCWINGATRCIGAPDGPESCRANEAGAGEGPRLHRFTNFMGFSHGRDGGVFGGELLELLLRVFLEGWRLEEVIGSFVPKQ